MSWQRCVRISKNLIIIADETKMVKTLGNFPLPVEIVKFGSEKTTNHISNLLKDLKYSGFKIISLYSRKTSFIFYILYTTFIFRN